MVLLKKQIESILFMKKFTLNCGGKLLEIKQPIVMAIINITPDSFFDGNSYTTKDAVLKQVEKCLLEDATIIDIGGASSRPGATLLTADEEWNRLEAHITAIHTYFPNALLSVDTYHSKVADFAIQNGVSIINDISGGTEDANMFAVAAKHTCPIILMHHQGNMQTMHQNANYSEILTDIYDFFIQQIALAHSFGIKDVILDVGFGFSKNIEQNYYILKNLSFYSIINQPILVGLSMKSMLYKLLNISPKEALNATMVANTVALQQGASILRVHDVKAAQQCIKIYQQLQ